MNGSILFKTRDTAVYEVVNQNTENHKILPLIKTYDIIIRNKWIEREK